MTDFDQENFDSVNAALEIIINWLAFQLIYQK